MLNPLSHYEQCGRKAGEAQNQRDPARAEHWQRHARAGFALEHEGDDRTAAQGAYNNAYCNARNIPRPEYFR